MAAGTLLVHPNYHSGGAEIAGNWPHARVAYLAGGWGALRTAGERAVGFIDAMTEDLDCEAARKAFRRESPDIAAATAITPAIYQAEALLKLAKEVRSEAVTVLDGMNGTFMYQQVLAEAPWIGGIVRGEEEAVPMSLVSAIDAGR